VAVFATFDHLDPVEVQEQQGEQHHHRDGDAAERGVHSRTTSVCALCSWVAGAAGTAGRRPASEILSRSATSIQLASSDEPPYDSHGVVMPVSGMRPETPPTMTKTCRPIENDRPPASSLPNESRTSSADRMPRRLISAYSIS